MKIFAAVFSLFAVLSLSLSALQAQVIVAEDFLYVQPTKEFGAGGGFTRQDYGGGQSGEFGQWQGRWTSFGDGVITGTDIDSETFAETFDPVTDVFTGVTRNGLSDNWLDRDFSINGLENEQTIFFGITMRSSDELGAPNSTFTINDARGPAQVGMGFTEGGFRAILGNPEEDGDAEIIPGPEITDGLDAHRLIGKLEINARDADELLTVWLDPSGVETADETAQAQADVLGGLSDFAGNLRLDHVVSPGLMFWDDLALGTTWESVAEVDVPRLTVTADTESGEVRWVNETGTDVDVTFLQLESERGLNDRRWDSLASQGIGGFQENSSDGNRFTESSLFGSLNLKDGGKASWGRIHRSGEDLIAQVGTSDGSLNVANVVYGEFPDDPQVDTDFDDSGATDVADIDALCTHLAEEGSDLGFDLTGDGTVDENDLVNFLQQTGSFPGDTNLDGKVEFPDFLTIAENFGQSPRTWSHGDNDCNGAIEFTDFLVLSDNFGRTSAAGAATSVPEPSGLYIVVVGLVFFIVSRRSRR